MYEKIRKVVTGFPDVPDQKATMIYDVVVVFEPKC